MNSLQLTEKTDKVKVNQLITSDYTNDDEKKLLIRYRRKITGNKVDVIYKFAKKCKYGRLFAQGGLSLQSFRREIRHTLAKDLYEDVDMVNAHPVILEQLCRKKAWKCDNLTNYVKNRDVILADIQETYHCDRDRAKKAIISIINGGDHTIDNSLDFIKDFKDEMTAVRQNVWNAEPDIVKFVEEKRERKNNKEGAVISHTMSKIENEILLKMKEFFDENEFTVGVLVFDGFMIEKDERLDQAMLDKCCEEVSRELGWDIKLLFKPMDQVYDLSMFKHGDYKFVKKRFEKQVFKINDSEIFVRIVDGETRLISKKLLMHTFGNKYCLIYGLRELFLKEWLSDEDIRTYEQVDFIPTPLMCDEDTWNLFNGFEAQRDIPADANIQPILDHIMRLAGNQQESYDYFINWMADIVQNAGHLSGVSIVLRSDEGAGKNIFIDFLGNKILGEKYYFSTCEPEQLFGRFAVGRKNKLLINLDETSGQDGFKFNEKIKNFITAESVQYEQKGVDSIKLRNYARWIFTTNNLTPVKISLNDRRFVVFDCDNSMCKNTEYFKELAACFADEDVQNAFFNHLAGVDLSNFDAINSRPKTEAYDDIQSVNIPVLYRFLDEYRYVNDLDEWKVSNGDLFTLYMAYLTENNYSTVGVNKTKIGRDLNKVKGFSRFKSGSIRGFHVCREELDEFLDKFDL